MASAQAFRRHVVNRSTLYWAVANIGVAVAIVLAVWTAVDPPRVIAEYNLSDDSVLPEGRTIPAFVVDKVYHCNAGDTDAWALSGLGWNAFLLLCASVLAFQMRNLKQDFNESRTLAFLIYSHMVFVILRICTYLLTDHFEGSTLYHMRGMLHAVDQIAACVIYFLPKLFLPDPEREGSLMEPVIGGSNSLARASTTTRRPDASNMEDSKVVGDTSSLLRLQGDVPEAAAAEDAVTAVPMELDGTIEEED